MPIRHAGCCERSVTMAQHRHQGHDPRTPGNKQERSPRLNAPNEVSADRSAQLELVTRMQLVGEIGRDFAVIETLDCEREMRVLRRRRDGVAALRLVSVFRGESHVDVLSRAMTRPPGYVENECVCLARLWDNVDNCCEPPDNPRRCANACHSSPAYRCSRHGSP